MTYLLLLVLATSAAPEIYLETYDVEYPTYHEIIQEAIHNCRGVNPEKIDINILNQLIEAEKEFNVPPELRGMILAAACQESAYNPKAKGDRKFSRNKKTPMAIGILQMWPIYEKMFPGLDRTNPKEAARAWMKHIVRQIPKIKRRCNHKDNAKIWVAAWVTGIRSKSPNGRCRQVPNHLRTLKHWQKNIKIKRKNGC